MKTPEEIIADVLKCAEKQTEWQASLRMDLAIEAINKAVQERNDEFKDFLFNMHTVHEGNIVMSLQDILTFLPDSEELDPLSDCCTAPIIFHDICSNCGEHI